MLEFAKIDMDTWARREHYIYYTEKLKIEFNMTANLNIKELLDFCHAYQYKFYPTLIYFVTKVLNKIDNFKMFRDQTGNLCVWNKIIPNYTIFHEDDCTFSDCWTNYCDDFKKFYQDILSDMKQYKDKKGIKVKAEQPPNFYCISCSPWTTFTGYGSRTMNGEPSYFPIITIGKYTESENEVTMPVNITIAHAVADGYHVGLFFQYLQDELTNQNLRAVIMEED